MVLSTLRVGFAGTPAFAAGALAAIVDAGFPVPLVLTQPDRPAGRGLKPQPSPVKTLALARALSVHQPRSLRLDGRFADEAATTRGVLESAALDLLVVAAYGLILPAWVLGLPRHGCINIHASLLPRWRGAAPIQRAVEAGDTETGITLMQMDEGLDTGPMLRREALAIQAGDSAGALQSRLAEMGARMVVDALRALQRGPLPAQRQPDEGVIYAHKIDKAEARIDWARPAAEIERRIRAFDPAPGCHFEWQGEALKVWRAAVLPGVTAGIGSPVVAGPGRLALGCGDGAALELLEIQRPGGRRQPLAQAWPALRPRT